MERKYDEERDSFHIPGDAGEYTDGLVAIMMRIPDGWGRWIRCDRGWYQIIVNIDRKLSELDPNYVVYQIKEKFGELRYYFEPTDLVDEATKEEMRRIVGQGEAKARHTCEQCGTNQRVRLRNERARVLTLCDACDESFSGW